MPMLTIDGYLQCQYLALPEVSNLPTLEMLRVLD